MNEDTTYSGWTNRATWVVNLWVMNDEPSYRLAEDAKPFTAKSAEEFYRKAVPFHIRRSVQNDIGVGVSLDNVDWQEIANAWNEE